MRSNPDRGQLLQYGKVRSGWRIVLENLIDDRNKIFGITGNRPDKVRPILCPCSRRQHQRVLQSMNRLIISRPVNQNTHDGNDMIAWRADKLDAVCRLFPPGWDLTQIRY